MNRNIKQFKLTNNDEIICDLLDTLEEDFIINKALKIVTFNMGEDKTYYVFKPFMVYQTKPNDIISLSIGHIISSAVPDEEFLTQYDYALNLLEKEYESNNETQEDSMDQLIEEIFNGMDNIDSSKLH